MLNFVQVLKTAVKVIKSYSKPYSCKWIIKGPKVQGLREDLYTLKNEFVEDFEYLDQGGLVVRNTCNTEMWGIGVDFLS